MRCIDGLACHIASLKEGVPECPKMCAIRSAKGSRLWPRIQYFAKENAECAEVLRRVLAEVEPITLDDLEELRG